MNTTQENKSHVGMGHALCPVCGTKHDENILIDKRLKPTLERDNFTGWKLCPEHEALRSEFLALVECSNTPPPGKNIQPEDAVRTGNICHMRRSVANQIFNVRLGPTLPMVFVEVGVIATIEAMVQEPTYSQSQSAVIE